MRYDLALPGFVLALIVQPARLSSQRASGDRYPRFDIAFGITMNTPADVNRPPKCTELALPCGTPRTFPDFGVLAQATVHVIRYAGLVAEGSTYGNAWDTVGVNRALTNHVVALLVGPQVTTGPQTFSTRVDTVRYRVFAQLLAGDERSSILPTRFALQPGVGLDGKLSWAPAWVRVEYDYRRTRGSPRNLSGSRMLLAVAIGMSGRDGG